VIDHGATANDLGLVMSRCDAARRERILDRAERFFIAAVRTEGLRLTTGADCELMAKVAFARAQQFEELADGMRESFS
jgi:hypothetical protein